MENPLDDMENDPDTQEEIKNLSTSHFDKICRSCLIQQEDLKPISRLTFENVNFGTLFETCASVQVNEDDGLPSNICDNCIQNFVYVYCFILKCKHSNEVLQLVVKKENTKFSESKANDCNLEQKQSNEVLQLIEIEENENGELKEEVQENFEAVEISSDINSSDKEQFVQHQSYMCNFCTLSFNTVRELKEHKRQEKHPKGYSRVCLICQKVISPGRLSQHMLIHTKEKPYQCEYCSRRFNFHYNLTRHIKTHSGERPHTCDICGKGFIRSSALKEHIRIHTGETPYICSYCGKGFKQSSRHTIHLRKHKVGNNKNNKSSNKCTNCKCEVCGKMFSSKSSLYTHMSLHGEKRFLCSECGKDFYHQSGLLSHLKVHTGGTRPYKCNLCSKAFNYLQNLKSHELVHKGIKPFICEICLKAFRQQTHLQRHLRTHTREKPYTCRFCSKSFSAKENLTVHVRIHTGETPYVCDVCGKGFYHSSTMKKHRNGHESKKVTK